MIENYILTNSQLDAIGRVCRYASENELKYKQFLCKENGYINTNYDLDLGLLNILYQQILELYHLKNISDNSPYCVSLWYAEKTIEALNHAFNFQKARKPSVFRPLDEKILNFFEKTCKQEYFYL